jgi:hypothetical protein
MVIVFLAPILMCSRQLVDSLSAIGTVLAPLLRPFHLQSPPVLVLDLAELNTF